jgi:hypothetical protein
MTIPQHTFRASHGRTSVLLEPDEDGNVILTIDAPKTSASRGRQGHRVHINDASAAASTLQCLREVLNQIEALNLKQSHNATRAIR